MSGFFPAYHRGRSWDGHPLEDGCPCPKAPCGLIADGTASGDCPEHALMASTLGHASISITVDVYAQEADEARKRAAAAMDRALVRRAK